jgi:prepilin-type N-terminal cleavage/methylation domain-containing protein
MPTSNPSPNRATPKPNSSNSPTDAGFTLLEGMIVVVLIALLAAIGVPVLMGFLDQRKVNATQFLVYQALRTTQQDATQQRQSRQFSLRERDGHLEWASHPVTMTPAQVSQWITLTDGVVLASEDNTLLRKSGVYYVRFDLKGNVNTRLGRITLVGTGGRLSHRCVIVSTLIGALRQGQGHAKPKDDRYCY